MGAQSRLGQNATCGIKATDHKLYCWGGNGFKQLGFDPEGEYVTTPTKVSDSKWLTVGLGGAFGSEHTCGIDQSQAAYCWGSDSQGQLGIGKESTGAYYLPQQLEGAGWTAIATGAGFSCGLRNDELYYWGLDMGIIDHGNLVNITYTSPRRIVGSWKSVVAGPSHICAVKMDGSLWCGGANDSGQLGDGTTTNSRILQQVGTDNDWSKVAAGLTRTCGIKQNGILYCWGQDYLGDGNETGSTTPVQIGDAMWRSIAVGLNDTCGEQEPNGDLYCFGLNHCTGGMQSKCGILGDGSEEGAALSPIVILK